MIQPRDFLITSLIWLLLVVGNSAYAVTSHCGGVFATLTDAQAADQTALPNCNSTCSADDVWQTCGLPTSRSIAASWLYLANPPVNNDSACYCAYTLPPDPLCPDSSLPDPITGLCFGTAEPAPGASSCSTKTGDQDFFSCTRGTYADALNCAEGAATPEGCELVTTTDPIAPQCTQTGTPVSQGGAGTTYTCVVDLTYTGADADPGAGLPQTDSDNATTSETGDTQTASGNDANGCTFSTTTDSTITNNGNGTLTRCDTVTTTRSGGSCPNAGTEIDQSCTTGFSDGSSTTTTSNNQTDSGGNPVSSTSTTSNGIPASQEPDESLGTYSGGGNCDTPPACSGDPLMCGLIDQEWQARCDFENSLDTFNPDAGGDVVSVSTVDVQAEMNTVLNTTGWIGNRTCPVIPAENVLGINVQWSFDGICQAYTILSFLVLAFAGFASLRVFMGAF